MEVRSKGTSEVRSEGKSEFLVAGASARAVDGLLGRLNVSGSSSRELTKKHQFGTCIVHFHDCLPEVS